jgi:hypothetical protein
VGITYLRLNTDIQQHAYVLMPDERELPSSLKKAMNNGNRLQDILASTFNEGTTIGMWDKQDGVPGDGDYPLMPNTVFSIELNATTGIPEWKKSVRIMLEEDGYWDGKRFRFISGRQKEIFLIPGDKQVAGV